MLKLTAVVSLMLIATWSQADSKRHKKEATASGDYDTGSTLWAASLSCDSCGSECASACGTRHFRSCCFNYLRRKRGPETIKYWPQYPHEPKSDHQQNPRQPFFVIDNTEPWMTNLVTSDFKPYLFDDTLENRLQIVYDA